MSLSKELFSSFQGIKQFLTGSYGSEVEFVSQSPRLYDSASNYFAEIYLQILNALEKSVINCSIDCFKDWRNLIEYIVEVEEQSTLNDICSNPNNPFKSTNLVILACKHNGAEILKYLFEDNGKALTTLSVGVGNTAVILPQDEDEECHNAFYYAICSSNIDLLDTLIHKWPGDHFTLHLEELGDILSSVYGDIRMKNIPVSEDMKHFVENETKNVLYVTNRRLYQQIY